MRIVTDMSFLSVVCDQNHFSTVLFDSVRQSHPALKQIIFQYMFQIIDCTPEVVEHLLAILIEDVDLTGDVLTTLEGFAMGSDDQDRIRRHVLNNILPAVSTKHLPTVVKFLIGTTSDDNALSTVDSFRTHLVIPHKSYRVDTFSVDDAFLFLVLQIRNALQFNAAFHKTFFSCLEVAEAELSILDVWVIFSLFSIAHHRQKAQQLISRIAGKTLTAHAISQAVTGHERALESLRASLVHCMIWCLGGQTTQAVDLGIALGSSLFTEFADGETLSDVIGGLTTQILIGGEPTAGSIADLLDHLALEVPEKLAAESHLIEGLLWSGEELERVIFRKIATTACRLRFRQSEDLDSHDGTHLHVGFCKMVASSRPDLRQRGVVGMGAVLNRYDEISRGDTQRTAQLFLFFITAIGDDGIAIEEFYNCLYGNQHRSEGLNRLLADHLAKELTGLISDSVKDALYGLADRGQCLDFLLFTAKEGPGQRHRQASLRNSVFIFASSGLRLLLDCHCHLQILDECRYLLEIPIRMSTPTLGVGDLVTALLFTHSFTFNLLNFF
jgi:hypothetical protein